jgi:hypothetical protein
LHQASGTRLNIEYKIPNAHICNDGVCFKTTFILVKHITSRIILGNRFLALLDLFIKTEEGISTEIMGNKILVRFILPPMTKDINILKDISIFQEIHVISKQIRNRKEKQIMFLKQDLKHKRIEEQLKDPLLQQKIKKFQEKIELEICANIPNAFWHRKNHVVHLPYESNFDEKTILTKAMSIQMNQELLEYCKKEIQDLLQKCLIRKSKSSWSCSAFYVQKNAELERGAPRLVINYKPLNEALKWIRYPIPNKKDLLSRLYDATIFSKFDMKSGF